MVTPSSACLAARNARSSSEKVMAQLPVTW